MKLMKQLFFYLLIIFASAQVFAQQKIDWQPLFNGKDLTGWKPLNGHAKFEVKNGEIVGTTTLGEPNSFLATEKDYGDFILEFQFKLDNNMNSGVQFRSLSTPDYLNGRVHGYQYEIDPSPRAWTAGIYDEARREWLYPMEYHPSIKPEFKKGVWAQCRIECIGNSIRTFINGKAAANLVDDVTPKGFIALQVHEIKKQEEVGQTIAWRNIRIQTTHLKPTPPDHIFVVNMLPNNLSDQEKSNGVKLLFDGQTTNGWRGIYKSGFPTKGWQVKDGELSVLNTELKNNSPSGGDIVTDKEYSTFILQFDFKMTDTANSGVKYLVPETDANAKSDVGFVGAGVGPEYQILDDALHPDAKMGTAGNRTLASLYDLIPAVKEPRARHKIGEWNRGMIVVRPDGTIEHWLNGWKMLEYKRGTQYFYALVARSKFEKIPNFGMAPQGHILLQDHGHQVSFRSIKIEELK